MTMLTPATIKPSRFFTIEQQYWAFIVSELKVLIDYKYLKKEAMFVNFITLEIEHVRSYIKTTMRIS